MTSNGDVPNQETVKEAVLEQLEKQIDLGKTIPEMCGKHAQTMTKFTDVEIKLGQQGLLMDDFEVRIKALENAQTKQMELVLQKLDTLLSRG